MSDSTATDEKRDGEQGDEYITNAGPMFFGQGSEWSEQSEVYVQQMEDKVKLTLTDGRVSATIFTSPPVAHAVAAELDKSAEAARKVRDE